MDKKDINSRFIQAIDSLLEHNNQLSKGEIAGVLGIKPSKLSEILNLRMGIGVDLAASLCSHYNISAPWLLYNNGSMFDTPSNSGKIKTIETDELPILTNPTPDGINDLMIPVYNAEASAGGGALRLDQEFIIGHVMVPFAKKGDIALTSIGNSMVPVISPGDILVVRQRFDWKEYLEPGKIYIIVTTEEVFVKVISSVSDKLTLHSFNPQFEDFNIPITYIHAIFKLIGLISQKSY